MVDVHVSEDKAAEVVNGKVDFQGFFGFATLKEAAVNHERAPSLQFEFMA
jgi:hypothetical protein